MIYIIYNTYENIYIIEKNPCTHLSFPPTSCLFVTSFLESEKYRFHYLQITNSFIWLLSKCRFLTHIPAVTKSIVSDPGFQHGWLCFDLAYHLFPSLKWWNVAIQNRVRFICFYFRSFQYPVGLKNACYLVSSLWYSTVDFHKSVCPPSGDHTEESTTPYVSLCSQTLPTLNYRSASCPHTYRFSVCYKWNQVMW